MAGGPVAPAFTPHPHSPTRGQSGGWEGGIATLKKKKKACLHQRGVFPQKVQLKRAGKSVRGGERSEKHAGLDQRRRIRSVVDPKPVRFGVWDGGLGGGGRGWGDTSPSFDNLRKKNVLERRQEEPVLHFLCLSRG